MYSTLSLTSALTGGWVVNATAALPPGKRAGTHYRRRQGKPQGRSGRVRKTSPTLGFDPLTVQPVASRYTGPRTYELITH
jgi:hypothetical protein